MSGHICLSVLMAIFQVNLD